MRLIVFSLVLLCVFAYASATSGFTGRDSWPSRSTGRTIPRFPDRRWPPPPSPTFPRFPDGNIRFRRDTDNTGGSLVIRGTKPLSGPDQRPSLDVDYKQKFYNERHDINTNAYGGLNIRPGQPAQPHVGLELERNFRNGFVRGYGQVQRGMHGRPDPTFGVSGGFRFRRDTDNTGGSLVIQGTKPLSGPDQRPSLDVDYKQKFYNERHDINTNAYGGLNIRPGQPAQPHVGLELERNFRNGFVRGYGQVQRGMHGRPDPTFGVSGGFRFRRDAEEKVEEVE